MPPGPSSKLPLVGGGITVSKPSFEIVAKCVQPPTFSHCCSAPLVTTAARYCHYMFFDPGYRMRQCAIVSWMFCFILPC